MDGDVGVGDVLLLAEAPLDVAEEVVRVRQVLRLLKAWTEGNSILFFLSEYMPHIHIAFSSESLKPRDFSIHHTTNQEWG